MKLMKKFSFLVKFGKSTKDKNKISIKYFSIYRKLYNYMYLKHVNILLHHNLTNTLTNLNVVFILLSYLEVILIFS